MAVEKLVLKGKETRFEDMAPSAPNLVKMTRVEVDQKKRAAGPVAVWKLSEVGDYLRRLVDVASEGKRIPLQVETEMVGGVRVVEQILGIDESG